MDAKIAAAIIGATSALIGVIIGGIIQSYLKDKEIRREKKVAEGAIALYLCQLRLLLENFADKNVTYKSFTLGITVNKNNFSEIDKIIDLSQKHDPYVLVKLFYSRQRLHNINAYTKSYKEKGDDSQSMKDKEVIVEWINIDAKNGLSEVDNMIKHTFNNAEDESKKYLVSNPDFKHFLEEILGNSLYQKFRRKFNFIGEI